MASERPPSRLEARPIDAVFADPTRCKRFAPDVAVHWYPPKSVPGDRCYCGEQEKRDAR